MPGSRRSSGGEVTAAGWAVAKVYAVRDSTIGWDDETSGDDLYVLLDQLQYDEVGRPFMHSRSFFLEGRFNFTVIRTH